MAWHAVTSFTLSTAAKGYQVECTMRDEKQFRHTPWTCPRAWQSDPEHCLKYKARLCVHAHLLEAGRGYFDEAVMQDNGSAALKTACESGRLVHCQEITVFKEEGLPGPFGGGEAAALTASALAGSALAAAHFAALALRCPRSARAAWRRAWAEGPCRGKLDPKVRGQFLGLRVQQVHRSIGGMRAVLSLIALASSAMLLLDYLDGGQRWSEKTVRNRLYQAESLPVLFLSVGFGILDWLPGGVTPLSLNFVSIFLAAGWAWKYSLMTAYRYEEQQLWLLSGRLLQGLFLGNAPLQSFLMTAVTMVDIGRHSALLLEHPGSYRDKQGCMCIVFAVVFWLFELNSWSLAKALVCEKRTARAHVLVHEVLSAVCDAVCSLDEDLIISAPSPQLAGLLLRQCGGSSLSGQSLADLMPPSDGERFTQKMAALVPAELITKAGPSTSLPRMAEAIHVCLRDANNSSVRMELFCSCTLDEDDRRCYLIGIKEEMQQREPREPLEPLPAGTTAEGTSVWSAQLARVPEGATALVVAATDSRVSSDEELSSLPSLPSTSSDRPSRARRRPHGEAHQVWLDTASPDLSILRCSAGFSALSTAGAIGQGFREWVNEPTFERAQGFAWRAHTVAMNSPRVIRLAPGAEEDKSPLLSGQGAPTPTETATANPRWSIVQFSSPIFYGDMAEGEMLIDVMRIGAHETSCSVHYATEDGSATAGRTYTTTSGELVFGAGESLQQIAVPLLHTGIFSATLEFKVHLSGACGCNLGIYLHSTRVKVIDDNAFPSNAFRAQLEKCKAQGVPRWSLYWEYCKWNVRSAKLMPLVLLTLVMDQLKNVHVLAMIWCDMYFVNFVCDAEVTEEELILPTRQQCTNLLAALHVLPYVVLYMWDLMKTKIDVEGKVALHLQRQMFRKYLNFSAEAYDTMGPETLVFGLLTEAPSAAAGFVSGLDLIRVAVHQMMSIGFVAKKNPRALPFIISVPLVILAWALFRNFSYPIPSTRSETTLVGSVVEESSHKHELVRAFNLRPQMNAHFTLAAEAFEEKAKARKVHVLNTDAVLTWIPAAFVGSYLVLRGHRVFDKEIEIGTFLAMVAVIKTVADATLKAYFTFMDIFLSFSKLQNVAKTLNTETELRKLKQLSRERRRLSRSSAARLDADVDAVPVYCDNLSYAMGDVELLTDIHVETAQGKIVGVRGPHRSGKNVLMRILGGLDFPTTGHVFTASHLRRLMVSREASFLDQSLVNNLALGCPSFGEEELARLRAILRELGLQQAGAIVEEELADEAKRSGTAGAWSRRLSYSDKQKLGLARAFLMNPEVLVLQKPFASFSRETVDHLQSLIVEHSRNRGLHMPRDTAEQRRPRTVFFSAEEAHDTACADAEWVMTSTGRENGVGLHVWTVCQQASGA